MATPRCLAETHKIVEGNALATLGSGLTGAYVSLKNAHKFTAVIHVTQANAGQSAITVNQATAVAGTSTKVIGAVARIWANEDCATSDTLVRQTDAAGFTLSTATKHKIVVIEVSPEALDVANGFDCVSVDIGSSSASNIAETTYYLDERYKQATPPTAVAN